MARAAGVSQSTVSRALRSSEGVSDELRRRVMAAAEALEYTPSELGRSLVTQTTRTVGMVVTDLDNPFYPFLIAPLNNELSELGYRMLLLAEADSPVWRDQLLNRSIDGVVLTTTTLDSTLPAQLDDRGVPFVFLTRESYVVSGDAVVVDNALGASILAGEILHLGHRRIGAILGPANTSTGTERRRGLSATLSAADIDLDALPVTEGPFIVETGYRGMHLLMADPERPTVVVCANDTVAIGALNAASELGLTVPDDVSVVGFDDLPIAGWELMQLTTIRQPMGEMAREAAHILSRRIESGGSMRRHERKVFTPQLVIRRSLGPPRRS